MANRLAQESSPYLLQHAHNPVHWHAWGEEAFAEARARGVPVFLSIGYSTCYWCHVMERESFEDAQAAAVMNDRFVCVKVDREEHPDVDEIYMAATVTLTGRGGWPMSVFLEPEGLRPFWAGTYFPPRPRHEMPSFTQVLTGMSDAYAQSRGEVLEQAEKLAGAVREQLATVRAPVPVGRNQIVRAVQTLLRMHDRTHGGFGGAPKFPQPVFAALLLELRGVVDEQTRSAIDGAVGTTLDRMDAGGVHDQVGGGFHRYAVDETWTVPHFEKMLYDQAQLASVYTRASVEYGHAGYERVARRTLDYVLREMTGPEGGFLSAQDAEVDGREGLNYLWNAEEIAGALGDEDGAWAAEVYGVARGPNFRDPHAPDAPASNVLRLDGPIGGGAERLDAVNAQLLAARDGRKQPRLDDKALASWNGMMVSALAEAAVAFGEGRYREGALRGAAFMRDTFVDAEGGVGRSWRGGTPSGRGGLEDAGAVLAAMVAAEKLEPDAGWLGVARRVAAHAGERFAGAGGVLFDAASGREDLFVRPRSTHDGATPSGQSLILNGLIDLAMATGETEGARAQLAAVSAAVAQNPVGAAGSTRGLVRMIRSGMIEASDGAAYEDSSAVDLPVEIYASEERLGVGPEEPAELKLVLKIREGFHVVAGEPGPDGGGLLPLRVGLIPGSGSGVAVYADYPEGERYEGAALGDEVRVLSGEVEVSVAVERSAQEWTGRPLLGVTYQACSDTECREPVTVELDVSVDLVGTAG